jgi:hypothetical protein
MIRLIVKELAPDPDGVTHEALTTFDVDLPEVEKYMRQEIGYKESGSTCLRLNVLLEPTKPSVTEEDIDYFCEEMESALTSRSGKGSEQRNVEESYLKWVFKKIKVEVRDEKP